MHFLCIFCAFFWFPAGLLRPAISALRNHGPIRLDRPISYISPFLHPITSINHTSTLSSLFPCNFVFCNARFLCVVTSIYIRSISWEIRGHRPFLFFVFVRCALPWPSLPRTFSLSRKIRDHRRERGPRFGHIGHGSQGELRVSQVRVRAGAAVRGRQAQPS